ncbi:MAG: 1-acyl-sn-glycerol-3-phosphate acyltransferase [Saprospiraceae bacterium]|nr:1-acyl-sn-glycerol-3-phosphate acyltransferase [Saprospiraceae bacterium]
MLYFLTRFPAKILLGTYFRNIHLNLPYQLPKDQAIIFAANHPTGFLEPCIMACWLDQPLYFVVRGNLFSKKLVAFFLETYHMIPFFRMKDGGYTKIRNNFKSFDRAHHILASKKPVMILAEGLTIHEKRLRPLMKGTARMALGAMDDTDLTEVVIIPVGINFTDSNQVRTEAMISFGTPIYASHFQGAYAENANKGILELTREVRRRLEPEVLIIQNPERDQLAEFFFELYRNDHLLASWPVTTRDDHRLRRHQQIANWINNLSDTDLAELETEVQQYQKALKEQHVNDLGLATFGQSTPATGLLLALMVLPALLGWLLHWPLLAFARYMVKYQVKSLEFKGSIFYVIILGGYLVFMPILLIIAALKGYWYLPLFIPILGYFCVNFRDKLKRWQSGWRLRSMPEKVRSKLLAWRLELVHKLP